MTDESIGSGRPESALRAEHRRLREVYDSYRSHPRHRKMSEQGPALRFMIDRKWEAILRIMAARAIRPDAVSVLALGAGGGEDCARFRDWGVSPSRIMAIDLLDDRARCARQTYGWMTSLVADAACLPFRSESFEIVYQSTMISSVLDAKIRGAIFPEVRRVMTPGGIFLSYDTRYPNPWNRHTRPLPAPELSRAFEGRFMETWRLTGLPPLLRLLAPWSLPLCR